MPEQLVQEMVPGTYEALRQELWNALYRAYRQFDIDDPERLNLLYVYIDQPQVIVEMWQPKQPATFYRVGWERDAAGEIAFTDIEEVEEAFLPVAQMAGSRAVRATLVSEFSADVPDVPPAPGVNIDELLDGDPEPVFVTLPVARVGVVSEINRVLYDEELVNSIVAHINGGGRTGIAGHISSEEVNSAFPPPDVYWVGAMRMSDTAYAKGYIPPGAPRWREHMRIMKAVGGKVSTSIWGQAVHEMESDAKGPYWRLRDFQMHQLDFGPYERTALKLGGQFKLTAEMTATNDSTDSQVEEDMDREQILAGLTPAEVPAAVRDAIIAEYVAGHENETQVAELTGERDQALQRVAELEARIEELEPEAARVSELEDRLTEREQTIAEFERQAFEQAIDGLVAEFTGWPVHDQAGQARLDALRGAIRARLAAEMGDTRDVEEARTTLQSLWDGEFAPLAEMTRDALAGPGAAVSGQDNRQGGSWKDEQAAQAAQVLREVGA